MEDPLGHDIREATWSIVLSVLMLAAGGAALFVPSGSGPAVTRVLGCLLIAGGILHVGFAWRADRPAAVVWEILLAMLYGGVGCLLLVKPAVGLEALALVLYLVLGGTFEITLAFALGALPGRAWLVIDGVGFLLLAASIWRSWPGTSSWVVGTLVAISLLVRGLARLMLSLAMRRVVRHGASIAK